MRRAMLQRLPVATSAYVDAQGHYDMDQDPLFNGMYEPGRVRDGHWLVGMGVASAITITRCARPTPG